MTTKVRKAVDVHVTKRGAKTLYPQPSRDLKPLSDYMIDRLAEPARTLVLQQIEGRRHAVHALLVVDRPGWVEVLIRNKAPETL